MPNRLLSALSGLLILLPGLAAAAAGVHTLAAGESARIALKAASGDYIEGRLQIASGSAGLELIDAAGKPWRRLIEPGGGRDSFRFVVDEHTAAMRLSAREATRYALTITRQVPRDAQQAPAEPLASPRLRALEAELARGGNTEAFWARMAREGTPLVEPAGAGQFHVSFLWRGARQSVRLFGGPARDHVPLTRLGMSDLWFVTLTVPAGTRASYQLAPDVPAFAGSARERRVAILATAQADPLNPRSWPEDAPDRFSRESVLELPAAPTQPGLSPKPGAHAHGSLQTWQQASALLGNTREIVLYRPPGFSAKDPDNLLLFVFDGPEYRNKVPTPAILDALIGTGRLPPVVAVFIANPDSAARARELPDNPQFARFMAEELLPRVAAESGLVPSAARTILAGSSYGGLASASVALRYPQHFGNVLSLSGSFWWSPAGTPAERQEYIAGLVARQPRLPARFFLAAGLFESGHGDTAGILETNRHLRDVLETRGTPVIHREYAGGHDYLVWRGALGDGLLALFGRPATP